MSIRKYVLYSSVSSHALNSEHIDTGMVIPSLSNDQSTVFCNMNPLS